MTNIKEYTPTETSVIEINEAGVRYLFCLCGAGAA